MEEKVMIFHNYEVPDYVPENEEFIYNLIEKMHWGGIDNGYLTGGLEH